MSKKPYPIRCGWCSQEFKTTVQQDEHMPTCSVRNAVHDAERRAGRILKFEEVKAVKDRAKRALEGGAGPGGQVA